MRVTLIALLAAATLLCGCSKKSTATPTIGGAPDVAAAAPAPPAQDNPMIAAGLDDLNRKIQQQQYEAAVGALVSMSALPKSDAQEAQYRARLRETATALDKRAQQGDPAAQQSAQMLGRMMTGR